jgi:hypothetical protein
VTYAVTVDTCLPEGAPELDPLQREGAVFLLRKGLDSVEAIEGPDGLEIEIVDHVIAVYPGGALLKLFVDAPALEFAEDAVGAVVSELLERSELLADWEISRCEVQLHPQLAQESLDAADGPDAPPSDVRERARRHAEQRSDTTPSLNPVEAEAMRLELRALASRLQAFSLASFGYAEDEEEHVVSQEDAELAAGAIVYATHILVDELFLDVIALGKWKTSVAESDAVFMVLDDLPDQFARQYTSLFARRLTVAAVLMTARFMQPGFAQLSCLAEELLLRILLSKAEVVADSYGLLGDGVQEALESFADEVYEDRDHEWLYEPDSDGIDDPDSAPLVAGAMEVRNWFVPFGRGRYVHPYAGNEQDDA